jgi:hypothetical protein
MRDFCEAAKPKGEYDTRKNPILLVTSSTFQYYKIDF